MTDTPAKDAKLVQYLNEANAKEKELEAALTAHIEMTDLADRKPYKKRLKDHLRETKAHSKALERRIKKLGGAGAVEDTVQVIAKGAAGAVGQAKSMAKGPLHMLRGTSEEEKLLKNAKTEYFNEHEEIATYTAIETLAEAVGDKETAKLARDIRRDEERMARYLEKLIPSLTKAVVKAEIPAAERRKAPARRRSSASSAKPGASKSKASSTRKRPGGTTKRSSTQAKRTSSTRKSSGTTRKRS